jgi:hypothetical protein
MSRPLRRHPAALGGLFLLAGLAGAQAPVNPDISVIGDVRATLADTPGAPDRGRLNLDFHELELAVGGPLNPYARAEIKLSFSEAEGVDIEEAFFVVQQGLPWGLQLKAGKYLVDLGRSNVQHPHQWLWIDRPLMYQELFGEEGDKDTGVNLNTLLPVGRSALGFSFNLLNTGGLLTEESLDSPFAPDPVDKAFSGRVSLFTPLNEHLNLDLGLSALRAQVDPVVLTEATSAMPAGGGEMLLADFQPARRFGTVALADLKLKWKRDEYSGLNLVVEGLLHQRQVQDLIATTHSDELVTAAAADRDITSRGLFAAGEWRFLKRWDSGLFYDYSQSATTASQARHATGAYGAFSLAEETLRISLALRHNVESGSEPWNSGTLQALFSLGPHKPHSF